jgi:transporter family protein
VPNSWIAWSLLALLAWGLYGFLPKLAVRHLPPTGAMIYYAFGVGVVAAAGAIAGGIGTQFSPRGAALAFFTGALGALGGLAYFFALRDAPVSIAAPLTAMYPVVTVLLAFALLREPVSARQWTGVLLALAAVWLMAEK